MDLKKELLNISFYSLFSKYSYLDDYGFTAGLTRRVIRKLLPEIPEKDSIEYFILTNKEQKETIYEYINNLLKDYNAVVDISNDLNKSIYALILKISSLTMDHNFQSLFRRLGIDVSTLHNIESYSKYLSTIPEMVVPTLKVELQKTYNAIHELRLKKSQVGTSLHLTLLTKRVIEHIEHCNDLLDLRSDIKDISIWKIIIDKHIQHQEKANSVGSFIRSHTDLLALEIVEHTSQHGEKYIAEKKSDYRKFFNKALLGGAIISIFALIKIILDGRNYGDISSGLLFSVNYAICFLLVKYLGGTIATKQPAMTASTIMKHLDINNNLIISNNNELKSLIRKVFRTQTVSLVGNFIMALLLSMLIGIGLNYFSSTNLISGTKATALINDTLPFSSGAIFYAAIAGVFLALSGIISGYFDNKVIFSKMDYRIENHPLLKRYISSKNRVRISQFLRNNIGVMAGNISLGFFLGLAFLLSHVMPFDVDIRHIAFSSANLGYAITNYIFPISTIFWGVIAVLLIGLTNLIVSFLLTFIIALRSRSVSTSDLIDLTKTSVKDILSNLLSYIFDTNKCLAK